MLALGDPLADCKFESLSSDGRARWCHPFLRHLPLPVLVSTLALLSASLTPCQFISVIQVIC